MSAFCTTRTKLNNACSPARMRGFPYSSSRRPRSLLLTNPVLLVSPRASQVSQQPYGSEPVHRLHLPALMRVTSLTPHQDDPVVRYPAITPTKYCTDSTTIHQVPYQQHHIGSQLSLQPIRHIMKVALKLIPAPNVHAREHHSSKTNLSNNLQHTHSVFLHVQSFDTFFHFRKTL